MTTARSTIPRPADGGRRPRRDARYWAIELVPQYLIGAAALFFTVTKWNAVRSALDSMQAVAINTAIALGWLLFSLVVMPLLVRPQVVRVVISSLVALGLAWVMFANAYRDKTVVETLRGLTAPTESSIVPDAAPVTPTPTAPPAVPVRVRSAALYGIDHRASGTASIIRRPDGTHLVGLEEIDIEPGPDYRVYVVPGQSESTSDGAVELDSLRGNQGTQFYDVPASVDVGRGVWTVLVWCKRFAVPVAAAVPV